MSKRGVVDRNQIYEKIAREEGIPVEQVEEIVRYQFKYVQKIMKQGAFENVRLPYFGIFRVKQKRLKNMKEHNGVR